MGIIFFRGTVRATARRLIWMLLECKRLGTKRKKKKGYSRSKVQRTFTNDQLFCYEQLKLAHFSYNDKRS